METREREREKGEEEGLSIGGVDKRERTTMENT